MKLKTINAVLITKFNEFSDSITDPHTRELVKANSIITGGCIASMLLKEEINDYDIYFTNKETVKAVAEYYVKIFNQNNATDGYVLDGAVINPNNPMQQGGAALNMTPDRIKIVFDGNNAVKETGLDEQVHELGNTIEVKKDNGIPYRPIFMSGNAITLSSKVQLIIRFYGNPTDIHDNYDFVHCTNYWTSKDRVVVTNLKALESLMSKELFYIGSKYPLASIIRLRKFINRQWSINAGQILKASFQLSQLDLTDVNVLEDQLVGVDLAYFFMLIQALRAKDDGIPINYNYISTIIDKIF